MNTEQLRSKLKGELLMAGDQGYKAASQPWNLAVSQTPVMVVMAEGEEDIAAAVEFAASHDLGVGVMATGHGVGTPCNGGVLINTTRMRKVGIDAPNRIARAEAGA